MHSTHPVVQDQILRRREVLAIIGLGKSFLHASVKAGTFPAPIPLSARAKGWRASVVYRWIAEREEAAASAAEAKAAKKKAK